MPSGDFVGEATITVMVSDSAFRNDYVRQRFKITVTPLVNSPAASLAGSRPLAGIADESNGEAQLAIVPSNNGQFSFQVTGLTGSQYVVQATSDLTHWTSVQTNIAPFRFQTSTPSGVSRQFFRAIYLPKN